eukprot:12906856-Prorocentrum_lima.AAC.1
MHLWRRRTSRWHRVLDRRGEHPSFQKDLPPRSDSARDPAFDGAWCRKGESEMFRCAKQPHVVQQSQAEGGSLVLKKLPSDVWVPTDAGEAGQ